MYSYGRMPGFKSESLRLQPGACYQWATYIHWMSFTYPYSVYTNKKLYHPFSLSCVLAVAPTMVRSAVLPKTTRLCGSKIVITLWLSLCGFVLLDVLLLFSMQNTSIFTMYCIYNSTILPWFQDFNLHSLQFSYLPPVYCCCRDVSRIINKTYT